MKNIFYLLLLICCNFGIPLAAQKMMKDGAWCAHYNTVPSTFVAPYDSRSDSIDIITTVLDLDITDFASSRIKGVATVVFVPKVVGVQALRLDLLKLTVDSVLVNGENITWSYNAQVIDIQFSAPLNQGQIYPVRIVYAGKPQIDASNWGGFYWQNGFAYNLGVGFDADPHNFGRAWFPCFDNFVERCSFMMHITTPMDKPAFCNGVLEGDVQLPNNKRLRSWAMDDPIPSYLACVAVGPFVSYERTVPGELNTIPVQIAVPASDTNKLKNSFIHLPNAVAAFEYWYGPYRWDKVGYSIVPFNAGAMEHATNIAYMRSAVDGTVNSETLMAHELSHHWWGDLATCSTAEDMWLNEGWASFSEHLFLQWVYGQDRYIQAVEANFLNVLQTTHVNEGGYRAVSGIPHSITYGSHVYNKGAVVAHNLRGYLGDSLFRIGLRAVMDQTQMEDFSSEELRDKLTTATGVDMTEFFNDWVFAPGFIDFTIDSSKIQTTANGMNASVYVKQRLRGAPNYYTNVPLELSFELTDGTLIYRQGMVSGIQSKVDFDFPANTPLTGKIWVNTRSKLTQARAVAEKTITNNIASVLFTPAKMDIKVTSPVTDPIKFRVEHHFSMPDIAGSALLPGYQLSNRFWVVDGNFQDNLQGIITLNYDGRGQLDQLDRELFQSTSPKEDSIRLMYRTGAGETWMEHPAYTKNYIGSAIDRFGQLRTSVILRGEYAIAKGPSTVSTDEPDSFDFGGSISPNPAQSTVTLATQVPFDQVLIFDLLGRLVKEVNTVDSTNYILDIQDFTSGNYTILINNKKGKSAVYTLIKA
jgi:aminopeptidase N